jgi:hypothetical protein
MNGYHVLSNDAGVILAVYGEALESKARDMQLQIIQEFACKVLYHHVWSATRLKVGGSISIKNAF